jgi:hypothetical protein
MCWKLDAVGAWKKARQWMEYGEYRRREDRQNCKNKNTQNKQKSAIHGNINPAKQNTKKNQNKK